MADNVSHRLCPPTPKLPPSTPARKLDLRIRQHKHSAFGLIATDAHVILYISEANMGVRVKSLSASRELLILLNDNQECASVMRGRLAAAIAHTQTPINDLKGNYVVHSMSLLGRRDIHTRCVALRPACTDA
jgi:hypothetical protein